ncbi:MAG: MATE family efflux transporter [Faecousia sp.]
MTQGGTQYLTICTLFSFGIFGEILFERLLQATGRTVYTMITQGTGAILNIVLDPLFIFGGLGIPAMGVAGAAVATVIGQIVAFLLAMLFHFTKNTDVRLSLKTMAPRWNVLKPILGVGIPSVIMVAIGSVMTFCMNRILNGFNTTAVAVFGSYFKIQSVIFMPIFGLNNALISIVAYNYGARKPERIRRAILLSMAVAFCFMLVGFLSFELCPDLLLSLFEPSERFLAIGRKAPGPSAGTICWPASASS